MIINYINLCLNLRRFLVPEMKLIHIVITFIP